MKNSLKSFGWWAIALPLIILISYVIYADICPLWGGRVYMPFENVIKADTFQIEKVSEPVVDTLKAKAVVNLPSLPEKPALKQKAAEVQSAEVVKREVKKEVIVTPAVNLPSSEEVYSGGQEVISKEDFITACVEEYKMNKEKRIFFLKPHLKFENETLGERRLEISDFQPKLDYINMKILLKHYDLTVVCYLPDGSRLSITDYNDLTKYNWNDSFVVLSSIKYSVGLGSRIYLVTESGKIIFPR